MKIKVTKAVGFSSWEKEKLDRAIALAERVLAHEKFKALVGAISVFPDPEGDHKGSDVLKELESTELALSLFIQSYSWWNIGKRGEVAHEDETGVTFNRRFFSGQDAPSLVNTIVHEALHQAGFGHDYKRTARRESQSPYAIGDIAEKVARELLKPVCAPMAEVESVT